MAQRKGERTAKQTLVRAWRRADPESKESFVGRSDSAGTRRKVGAMSLMG